jgi:hypothetical protein
MIISKEILTAIAICLTFVAFVPYIISIIKGGVKPHVFSWVIWSITTLTVFAAQWSEGAGVAAWSTGISGCVTIIVAILAFYRRSDITITRSDWVFFIIALMSLPLWVLSSDPMWTVIILTGIDVIAFIPTIRKTYVLPYSESIAFIAIFAVRDLLVLGALEHYSVTTMIFPAAISISCTILIILMVVRRATIKSDG